MTLRLTKAQEAMIAPGNCARCGKWAKDRNTAGECNDCHNLRYYERKAERKAQLGAMARCEVPGCTRRASYLVGSVQVGLCGHHKARAVNYAPVFLPFATLDPDRETIIRWATRR